MGLGRAGARFRLTATAVRRIENHPGRLLAALEFTGTVGAPAPGEGQARAALEFTATADTLAGDRWQTNVWRMEQTRFLEAEAVKTWQEVEIEAIARALKRRGVGRRRWITAEDWQRIQQARADVAPVAERAERARETFKRGDVGPALEPHEPRNPGRPLRERVIRQPRVRPERPPRPPRTPAPGR